MPRPLAKALIALMGRLATSFAGLGTLVAAALARRVAPTAAQKPSEDAHGEGERVLARIAHRLRSELDLDSVLDIAVRETGEALGLSRCFVRLGEQGEPMPIEAEWTASGLEPVGDRAPRLPATNLAARLRRTVAIGAVDSAPELDDRELGDRETLLALGTCAVLATPIVVSDAMVGVFSLHRATACDWNADEIALAEAVAHEVGLAIRIARLLRENERRLRQHEALLDAAEVLASELEFDAVIRRLVEEVVALLRADAADCWIFDESGLLRCRAVHNLPETEIGRLIPPEGTIGKAIEGGRPVLTRDFGRTEEPPPSASYREFEEAMDAPIVVHGEVRGVLGVCSRRGGHFVEGDVELLEAFANLASIALRNAEAFEERTRQARAARGFFRIAAVLGKPLSLAATLDAVAEAAGEALGADAAALLLPRADKLELSGSQGLPDALRVALTALPSDEWALIEAAREGHVLASMALEGDDRFGSSWREVAVAAGFRSLLAVPVESGADATETGVALVFLSGERRFTDEDLELAQHLAGAARGALERAGLYEEERRGRSLAQQLARTASMLATELDPARVVDEVVRHAPLLVAADAGAIRVLDGDELVVSAVAADGAEDVVGDRTPATAWLSGDVAQSRAPLALADAGSDERLRAVDRVLQLGYAGYLGVPLIGPEDALLGVLSVYSRRAKPWRPAEVEGLLALAANASAALSNAELYQRVALEKDRNDAILANVAEGIVAVDRDGGVVLWNAAAERITGVPAAEARGHTLRRVLGRDLEADATTAAGDRILSILRDGEEVWLSLTEAVMRDPAGSVAGRIYAFRDISADRVVEEMKSEFVSTVSQELRRPLASIYGFAETLLRQDVRFGDDERRTFLTYIATESERLAEIVDQLLNVARLDAGELELDVTPTDVGALASDVVEAIAAGNGQRFVVDLPDQPIHAAADAEKLRQVLAHLVDNAVKYSPERGTITVAARRRRERVEISVADEGVGIPDSEQERIFRKFYRGETEGVRPGGTGLGLFIAQGLVVAMGGRISVSSREGDGSSFAFELPLVSGDGDERVTAGGSE